jgi:hypothetical protein
LPHGIGLEWTGLSYQEQQSGSQVLRALRDFGARRIPVLAALYESWTIPLSVMLVIPLGIVGAILAATLRGLYNDIYFQVGLLTTMGLSAKNAILIVQFAVDAQARGESPHDAALGSGPAAPASDPDDVARLYRRRHAARGLQRRRRRQPERHRHGRHRRHAVRHRARDLLRAAVLRDRAKSGVSRDAAAPNATIRLPLR